MTMPDKRCGACKACCRDLKIDTPEFHKEGLVLCPHYTGTGCGIYAKRYKVCREFLCGWRLFPELDEAWRPDLSGVLILQIPYNTLPEKYQTAGHGLHLVLPGGEAAVTRPGFAEYVCAVVGRGVAVYLSVFSSNALINQYLEPVAAANDIPAAGRVLLNLHRLLVTAGERKSTFRALPYLYRLQLERWRSLAGKRFKNGQATE
jgi:hypothetical protein